MKTGACFAFLMLALAVGVVSLAVAEAQKDESHQFADRDGVWTVKTEDQGMSFIRLSPAQRQAVVQKRDAIFEVVRSTKVLNPLKGVDIVAVKSVEARADAEGQWPTTTPVVMQIDLTFGSFFKDAKTGRVLQAMIEAPRLYVVTNDLEALGAPWKANGFWYEGLRDEQGRELFLDPRVSTTIAGLRVYRMDEWSEAVILTNGRPLWVGLTEEQFLRARMSDARRRRADEIEKRRREGSPQFSDEESVPMKWLRQFEKELAALTPGERQQPAYYAPPPADQPMLSGLTRRDAPGARLVVMANPDYFDPSLPRTAVQLIACEFKFQQAHDAGDTAPLHADFAVETLDRLLKQFEYEKLASLIEGKH